MIGLRYLRFASLLTCFYNASPQRNYNVNCDA